MLHFLVSVAALLNGAHLAQINGDSVRINQGACAQKEVLAIVGPQESWAYRAGVASVSGQVFEICWTPRNNGIWLQYPDGDRGWFPGHMFRKVLEI